MKRKHRRLILIGGVALVAVGAAAFWRYGRAVWYPAWRRVAGKLTVEDTLRNYGPAAETRLKPHFEKAGVAYPPPRVTFLAFKEEKRLELWVGQGSGWVLIRSYPVLAASGTTGPKLRRGDRQVPEGIYRIEGLNPNSSYHLSMKLDYPNAFDRARAKKDGRTDLGGDIFIHGKDVSIGCLAVGDPAIEELFVLVARVGIANAEVIVAPADLRGHVAFVDPPSLPSWVPALREEIRRRLRQFPVSGRLPVD